MLHCKPYIRRFPSEIRIYRTLSKPTRYNEAYQPKLLDQLILRAPNGSKLIRQLASDRPRSRGCYLSYNGSSLFNDPKRVYS